MSGERKVRDLQPIEAVRCHLRGGLVPFLRACKGEGTRSKKPCGFYVPNYMCSYLLNMGIGVKGVKRVEIGEPCVEHHWEKPVGDNRCTGCQMKYSYWVDVKASIDRGDVEAKDWMCKPHYHPKEGDR